MSGRILVAGIGNIFLGDDAFGVEVARRLTGRWPQDHVQVADFGIRGFDLAYALLDGYDTSILVDATQRDGQPGTLYVIEPELDDLGGQQPPMVQTHNVNPVEVLSFVRALGDEPGRIYVVGCEPKTFGPDEGGHMGLSPPVEAAVGEAVGLVESLVEEILAEGGVARRREQTEAQQ